MTDDDVDAETSTIDLLQRTLPPDTPAQANTILNYYRRL
jgi:hypothetical protein